MPAQDVYHQQVRAALIKDGWQITRDNYQIKFKEVKLYADLLEINLIVFDVEQEVIVQWITQ